MIFEQFTYPFTKVTNIDPKISDRAVKTLIIESPTPLTERRVYKHIGIEHPQSPILCEIVDREVSENEYSLNDILKNYLVATINPPTGGAPEDKNKERDRKFYIADKDIFEVKLDTKDDNFIRIWFLNEKELENRYLIINVGYEIAN